MERTSIYLERRQTTMLDRLAAGEGVSRAEVIRRLLDRALGGEDDSRDGELMRTYRRSHVGVGTADYLIAATAEVHGAELATLNVRHFPMFPDLRPPFPLH